MQNDLQTVSNNLRITIAKVLAIVGSCFVLLIGLYWTFLTIQCFTSESCRTRSENGLIPFLVVYCFLLGGTGFIKAFTPNKNRLSLGIIGVLAVPIWGAGLLFIFSGLLVPDTRVSKVDPNRAAKLGRLEEMVQAGRLETALPEIYKLSRANPDDPRVRELIRRCRAQQQESQR